ncbi:hypothetical protein MRX96_039987 [Rhipicephalus microplus]
MVESCGVFEDTFFPFTDLLLAVIKQRYEDVVMFEVLCGSGGCIDCALKDVPHFNATLRIEKATDLDASPGPRLDERDTDGLRLADLDLE